MGFRRAPNRSSDTAELGTAALSQMRQASFLVKGGNGAVADVLFVSLGYAAGNVLEHVNRWLGQLGQPQVTEQKLNEMAQRLHTSLGDMTIVDLAGLPDNADPARDGRIVAAMMTTSNATLFFKMRGNADLTEAQKGECKMGRSSLRCAD